MNTHISYNLSLNLGLYFSMNTHLKKLTLYLQVQGVTLEGLIKHMDFYPFIPSTLTNDSNVFPTIYGLCEVINPGTRISDVYKVNKLN